MQHDKIVFGTDGWRGVIAEDFTFENVRRVAQATADYWNSLPGGPKTAIVGYDCRFLSETYAKLVCEVLDGNGITALYTPEAVPTPAVTYAVRDRRLCGAVMITASHNPPQFNGYKIKADFAGPADPSVCAEIEKRVDASPVRIGSSGHISIYDPRPAHIAAVKQIVDFRAIRRAKPRVAIDSMHGCGGRILEGLVGGSTSTIRAGRDVLFGGVNPEPTGKNLHALCAAVKQSRAHIGLATDGDADRVGVVDDTGRYVSIQIVFALLLLHLLRNRKERGGLVVRSTNGTVLIDRICRAHGLEMAEVPVGFKWICQKMRETDVLLGGEESGGMGFRGHIPERDGILANLMLLEMLAVTGKRFSQLANELQKEFGRSVYDRVDISYPLAKRQLLLDTLRQNPPRNLQGIPLVGMKDFDGVKYLAADDSWLMFRASGTEPIVRIYSEASSAARVRRLLAFGETLARKIAE